MKARLLWLGAAAAVVLCGSGVRAKDLGDLLLQKGLITEEELQQVREEEKQKTAAEASQRETLAAKVPKWLDRLTPFGDLRLRDEGFYQQDLHARDRFRLRGRIGLLANVADEISGTLRLATGNSDNPISTNQTLGDTFTSKTINLDWAYLTLKPGKTFGLEPGRFSITAGKFGINTQRFSELVWDDDVSPEGATETLTLVQQRDGWLRGLRLHALQWIVDEVADGADPWISGSQFVGEAAPNATTSWTLAVADYYFDHTNAVARKFLNPYDDPPANTKPNSNFNNQLANSNAVVRDSTGKILKYRSAFNVVNAGSEFDAADPAGVGIPAGVYADVAYNTAADGRNLGLYAGGGIGRAGKDWYHDALRNQGDWGLAYTYAWIEQDAVLSLFTYSEINEFSTHPASVGGSRPTQKGGTNLSAHIVRLDYVALASLQLTAKVHFINALDRGISNVPLTANPTLVRTQLDALLRF